MAKSIVMTICRTIAIVAVWINAPSFVSGVGPMAGLMRTNDAGPIYLLSLLLAVGGAVVATAILWLGRRPRPRQPATASAAVEVALPSTIAA